MDFGLGPYTERSGQLSTGNGLSDDLMPVIQGVFRHLPTNRVVVVDEDAFRLDAGGIYGDEHGPIHVDLYFKNRKKDRPEDGGLVGLINLRGTGSAHGTRALNDHLGARCAVAFGRVPGKYADSVSISNQLYAQTTAGSTNNATGVLDDTKTEIGLDDVTKAAIGNVFRAEDSAGNWRVGVISAVLPASKEVKFYTQAGWGSGTVSVGATLRCASFHRARSTLRAALAPNATSLQFESGSAFRAGDVVCVVHGGNGQTNAPAFVKLTEMTDSDVATIPALAGAVTYPVGSVVVSLGQIWAALLRNGRSESLGEVTFDVAHADYVGVRLGQGVSMSVGAALAGTTKAAAEGAIASNATSVELAPGVGATLSVRGWYQFGPDVGPKVTVQVKAINGDVVSFDSVGTLAAPVANTAAIKPITLAVLDPRQNPNRSLLIVVQEMNAAGIGESTTTFEGLKLPAPFTSLSLSGSSDGAAPTGVSQVVGAVSGTTKTGLYLLEDMPEIEQVFGVAIPGLDISSSSSRAAVEVAAKDLCAARGVQFVGALPSDITQPGDAIPYRHNTLKIDSRHEELVGPRVYVRHPDGSGRRFLTTLEGCVLGIAARRIRGEGKFHKPGFNEVAEGVVGVEYEVGSTMFERWRDAGINAVVLDGGAYKYMSGRTLFLNVSDARGRHFAHTARWLNRMRVRLRAVARPFRGQTLSDTDVLRAQALLDKVFKTEFEKGAFEPQSVSDAYYVATRRQVVGGVTQLVLVYGAVPVRAVEQVPFEVNLYDGSVREVA